MILNEEQRKEFKCYQNIKADDIIDIINSNVSDDEKAIIFDKKIKASVLTAVQFFSPKYSGISIASRFYVESMKNEKNKLEVTRNILSGFVFKDTIRQSGVLLNKELNKEVYDRLLVTISRRMWNPYEE